MNAAVVFDSDPVPVVVRASWKALGYLRPVLAATACRYLDQIEVSLRPTTVAKCDQVLADFCWHLLSNHPEVSCWAEVERAHIESYKLDLGNRHTANGPLKANTVRAHLTMLKVFLDRTAEWGWDDTPARARVFGTDMPPAPNPLPKALDDAAAARFMAAARDETDPLTQLCVEMLARTAMRVSELCDLPADAVERRSGAWWLRVPVGKLRNDRYIPLHPRLVELLDEWQRHHHHPDRLITAEGVLLERHRVARMVRRVGRKAGVKGVHPHQLRHTLATQAINRGMRLEAVAELLGHRNLKMTMTYARISNRVVADQFQTVSERVDALYADPDDDQETPAMRRLRLEYRRMLGNGWCTRPKEMDCQFESICEGCGFFHTGVEFLPTLKQQRDHAAAHDQPDRQQLFQQLITGVEEAAG
jgi:integrase